MLNNFTKGFLAIIVSLLCFSIIETVGSLIYQEGANPLTLLILRSLLASIIFLGVILARKKSLKIERKDIKRVLLSGGLLALHLFCFWQGIKIMGSIATVLAIFFTFPFWVMILSVVFLKKRFTTKKIVSLILGTIGAGLAVKFAMGGNLAGVVIMFVAAISWAIYMLVNSDLMKKYGYLTILFYNFLTCLVAYLCLQSPAITIGETSLSVLGYSLIIAIVSTYLAYAFFHIAIKRIGALNTGIVNLGKPILSISLAFIILGQTINWFQALGLGLIIFGVYLLTNEENNTNNNKIF